MASRPGFYVFNGKIYRKDAEFQWNAGFADVQKKKNVAALHKALGSTCLEISTKSDSDLGKSLSAFILRLDGYPLENIYQSSKAFTNGGPFSDLLQVKPKDAKNDERLRSSGALKGFQYDDYLWPLVPRSLFYDYIYCKAVKQCIAPEKLHELLQYKYFTDIEFNPNKSVSTQAEAAVVVKVMIEKFGEIPVLNPGDFEKFYSSLLRRF